MYKVHSMLLANKILERTTLVQREQISPRHWLITIGFPYGSQVKLNPGDHVYIFPENDPILVDEVSKRLIRVSPRKVEWKNSCIPASTAKTALTKYLDLTATPTAEQIEQWISFTNDEKERRLLQCFIHRKQSWKRFWSKNQTFNQWSALGKPNILDFLLLFPNLRIPIDFFVSIMKKMLPRTYSVAHAGCKSLRINSKHYLVTDLVFELVVHTNAQTAQTIHNGICSGFLTSLPIGHRFISFKFQNELFKLPQDLNIPLLMISTGSAIAPFRGFWKHKVAQECNNLKLDWLYFGCRNEEEALFYDEASFHVNVRIAFSRKKGMTKSYVQDLLKQDEIHIYNLIVNQQANVYICGRTAMVSDVEATLNTIVGPVANVKALKSNGKLMTEHFG